ncbi:hypothetical protein AB1N83_007637 [Pleurotus pulmonarius]
MSLRRYDEEDGILTRYSVYLEGVSLDFDSSWTGAEAEICQKYRHTESVVKVEGCGTYDFQRSLVWAPSTLCTVNMYQDIFVRYGERDDGLPHTDVIAGWGEVATLARNAEYQRGIAHLEIKQDIVFGTSTVSLMVRKVSGYQIAPSFKLSVVIENIHRKEWKELLEYQQYVEKKRLDCIVYGAPFTWRGNERVIEQMPKSLWQDDQSHVINNIRHIARELMALAFKYADA